MPTRDEFTRRFVVQKHWASRLHYDFRLELDGTLKSWAVPKGPSLDPGQKRMAVPVEDHALSYADFEGEIAEGHYGAGQVIVWDRGTWQPLGEPVEDLAKGRLRFELHGEKLAGRWTLLRMSGWKQREREPPWLLIKERDKAARPAADYDVLDALPHSVLGSAVPVAAQVDRPKPTTEKTIAKDAATPGGNGFGSTKIVLPGNLRQTGLTQPFEVSHADRVIDRRSGATKLDLVTYYAQVAELLLPHLKGRPIALLRAPRGVTGGRFFQKHADAQSLPGIKRVDASIDSRIDADDGALLEVANAKGLLNLAQLNMVELHGWNALTRSIARPDRLTFDLDPGEGVGFDELRSAARCVQEALAGLDLTAFLKTSGGRGLHLVVPIARRHDWDTVRGFSKALVEHLTIAEPARFVSQSGAKNRVGKIFIDCLRNGFGATTVSAWSARARPGLGVSVPIGWDELDQVECGDHWTIKTIDERFEVGNSPWHDYEAERRNVGPAAQRLAGTPASTATRR